MAARYAMTPRRVASFLARIAKGDLATLQVYLDEARNASHEVGADSERYALIALELERVIARTAKKGGGPPTP